LEILEMRPLWELRSVDEPQKNEETALSRSGKGQGTFGKRRNQKGASGAADLNEVDRIFLEKGKGRAGEKRAKR